MAKLNGGVLTKAKGKIGGIVFQQYEGMQIAKEYQPNVKNPNVPLQVATRSRFSLASKVVALTFPWLLPVMKANGFNYSRFQRGDVLKRLMGNITYDSENENAVLNAFPNLRPNGATTSAIVANMSVANNEINLAIESEESMAGAIASVIAMYLPAYAGDTRTFNASGALATQTPGSATYNATLPLPSGFQGSIVILAYVSEESESASGVTYKDLVGSSATTIATLGNDVSMGTAVNISNLEIKTHWVA